MNFESPLRISGRLLSVGIIIASVMMITSALPWFRRRVDVHEHARRSELQKDLQHRYQEFYSDGHDSESTASVSRRQKVTSPTGFASRNNITVSHQPASASVIASNRFSVEQRASSSSGGPSVTVPVTINVNNGDLLSELLQVRQEVSDIQQLRKANSASASASETAEREFSYVVHDGQVHNHTNQTSTAVTVTSTQEQTADSTDSPKSRGAKMPSVSTVSMPGPENAPSKSLPTAVPNDFFEPRDSFSGDERLVPDEDNAADEDAAPVETREPDFSSQGQAQLDNFVPPDAGRVMPMSYQSVSAAEESSDSFLDDEPETEDNAPFLEFVENPPQPLPDLETQPEEEVSPSMTFEPVTTAEPPVLPAIEPSDAAATFEPMPVQPDELQPAAAPVQEPDRRTRLSQAFAAVRGLPPESLFAEEETEPNRMDLALIPLPDVETLDPVAAADEDPFQSISIPSGAEQTSEETGFVQTTATAEPQTAVPPVPEIAFAEDDSAEDAGIRSEALQIPAPLELLALPLHEVSLTDNQDADSEPTDIFRLPEESEIVKDPGQDRALRIAQSPVGEEYFDNRSSEDLIPVPEPPLTIPDMAQTPSERPIPVFVPSTSMPPRPVYRTRDPNASTMSLAMRRMKKRMAQLTGGGASSASEIDHPDFEMPDMMADVPGFSGFETYNHQAPQTPEHRPSPRSFAKGYNPQQTAPRASRSTRSFLALSGFSRPQFRMPPLAMPELSMPELTMPSFMTAQEDCQHCNGGYPTPSPMRMLSESPTIHRAMSTIRFAGKSRTVE